MANPMPIWLRVKAPFAAYRTLAGAQSRRDTLPIMPPSQAWGLALNLAGVEIRTKNNENIQSEAPALRIALGEVTKAGKGSLFQQVHVVKVGASSEEDLIRGQGCKSAIAVVDREVLVGLDMVLGIWTPDTSLLQRIQDGTLERPDGAYGLPFAGDNNFLFEQLEIIPEPTLARWYCPLEAGKMAKDTCRLTIGVNRQKTHLTTFDVYFPSEPAIVPPERAWTWTPRAPRFEVVV